MPSGRVTGILDNAHYLPSAAGVFAESLKAYRLARSAYVKAREWSNTPSKDDAAVLSKAQHLRIWSGALDERTIELRDAWLDLRKAMSKAINNKLL